MNHRAIVLKQYQDKAAKLRAELADTETAIRVLGGTVAAGAGKAPRPQTKAAKGKKATTTKKAATGAAEVISPALAAELVAIKNNASLSPIQKAQESRKVRAKYRGQAAAGSTEAAAPAAKKPEGAVLSEAVG